MLLFRPLISPSRRAFSITSELCKGHNKWANIKGIKAANDQAKSAKQSKLLSEMTSAVVDGFDIKKNNRLAAVQDRFRQEGISIDTFNKYLEKLKVRNLDSWILRYFLYIYLSNKTVRK
jgi:transcriptional/translational regulatory protein YebC/TACO1